MSSVTSCSPNNAEIKNTGLIRIGKHLTLNPYNIKRATAFQCLFFMVLCIFCFYSLYVFLCFLCVWNLLVKKKKRVLKLARYPNLLYYWRVPSLNLPMASYLYALIFIYDHLWGSLLFMRIFLNLFLFMINYFITYSLSHLPICAYLFSSSFIIQNLFSFVCIHLDQ